MLPRRLAERGWILLCAVALVVTGCREEIAYDPAEDEAKPPASSPATTEPAPTEPARAEPEKPLEPEIEPPTEEPATASEPETPQSTTPPPEFDENDLFGIAQPETEAEPSSVPDEKKPQPAPQREESLLPWENEDDRYRSADEAQAQASGESEPGSTQATDAAPSPSSLLPWENEQAASSDTPTAPPAIEEMQAPAEEISEDVTDPVEEPAPQPAVETTPQETAEPQWLASADTLPEPASGPTTSRHAAWLLGSKLSYVLLAPAEEAARVRPELEPLASLLGVELPDINFAVDHSEADSLAQVLRVGREVGEQLSARHDTAHAALVEIAFKSNVLLAAYGKMPHLAHSIGGSVAAASVRAEVPESIWQPWQDRVVAGESTEAVEGAILELHAAIDNFLRNPPSESPQAILR